MGELVKKNAALVNSTYKLRKKQYEMFDFQFESESKELKNYGKN